jgi:hypothetical protein
MLKQAMSAKSVGHVLLINAILVQSGKDKGTVLKNARIVKSGKRGGVRSSNSINAKGATITIILYTCLS